jgi:hypothetical protein
MSPRTILRASQSVNPGSARYLPLLLAFGVVDAAPELGIDDDELVDESLLAGGVPDEVDDAPLPVDGVVVSGVVDEELDDIEPLGDVDVDGVVVDDDDDVDGDGVTTGGVVGEVVDEVSRLQPATPSTIPVQSSVTNAVFIAISRWVEERVPSADLAESMP